MTAAEHALDLINDGNVVGLGSGQAATAFVQRLAERVRAGLKVRGVPTSKATADFAAQLGIPLTTVDAVDELDVTVDGADEVDDQLNLIKGWGGALVREMIVAAASRRVVILAGREKLVTTLGSRGRLPVEVVPFGLPFCRRELAKLGLPSVVRSQHDQSFVTDNGNHILDCQVSAIPAPVELEQRILAIPGVVGTGLFLGMADTVVIESEGSIEVRHAP